MILPSRWKILLSKWMVLASGYWMIEETSPSAADHLE